MTHAQLFKTVTAFQGPLPSSVLLCSPAMHQGAVVPFPSPFATIDVGGNQCWTVGRGATNCPWVSATTTRNRRQYRSMVRLRASDNKDNDTKNEIIDDPFPWSSSMEEDDDEDVEEDREFLLRELAHIESLEELTEELFDYVGDEDDEEEYIFEDWDVETLEEFFQSLGDEDEDDDEVQVESETGGYGTIRGLSASLLEHALAQGVVAADAGVGSGSLPGDFGYDPLGLSTKDYIFKIQSYLWNKLPERGESYNDLDDATSTTTVEDKNKPRPRALILRDYREAEIRHGRVAMLAVTFWPLQELLDRMILQEDFDSVVHSLFNGGVTLPYIPLLMTAIMLLLGYLDIYSRAVKDMDKIGEAFLPGDCFWDPLQILTGAPDSMKRNMQERELFNGRFAMLAFAMFIFEETATGKPVVSIEGNDILFEPAYQIPFIQQWLDEQFSRPPTPVYEDFLPDDDLLHAVSLVSLLVSNVAFDIISTLNIGHFGI